MNILWFNIILKELNSTFYLVTIQTITMGKQTTAWKCTGRGGLNAGRGNDQSQTKGKQKEMRFATQEQMAKGYYSTYNAVKDTIMTKVQ